MWSWVRVRIQVGAFGAWGCRVSRWALACVRGLVRLRAVIATTVGVDVCQRVSLVPLVCLRAAGKFGLCVRVCAFVCVCL